MNTEQSGVFPLAVVGCDFRIAPTKFREKLVMSPENRQALFHAIRSIDPAAGLLVLDTCNRIEWLVSTEQPEWMSDLIKARMVKLWQDHCAPAPVLPEPYVITGKDAVIHVLRVVAGLESLAAGEAQIAGQFQKALKLARTEKTSSIIINGLGSVAGRIAKTATRIGFRSNAHTGIHGLVARSIEGFISRHSISPATVQIAVIGMGEIGRKTAATIEEFLGVSVVRVNRTVPPRNEGDWIPLADISDHLSGWDMIVTATGSRRPIITLKSLSGNARSIPLLVMDIGIPRQVDTRGESVSGVDYRNIDDLTAYYKNLQKTPLVKEVEDEIVRETARYRRFCMARDMVSLLDTIHQRRREYIQVKIPAYIDDQNGSLDETERKRMETTMQKMIREYSNDVFNSIHQALEDYRRAE